MSQKSLNLFQLGLKGVNVDVAPTHLSADEMAKAQNIEVAAGVEGGFEQRAGMTVINPTRFPGTILAIHDVPPTLLTDFTPYLYAPLAIGSAHKWRKSADGINWSNDDVPVTILSSVTTVGYFKVSTKVTTVKGKLYYFDNNRPFTLYMYDGTANTQLSTVPPATTGTILAPPDAPTIGYTGVAGTTTATYQLVAVNAAANSDGSTAGSYTLAAATLDSTHFTTITPVSPPNAGAIAYDVYRTAGGASTGKIGQIAISGGAFTYGNGSGLTGSTWTTPVTPTSYAYNPSGSPAYEVRISAVLTAGGGSSVGSGFLDLTLYDNGGQAGGTFYISDMQAGVTGVDWYIGRRAVGSGAAYSYAAPWGKIASTGVGSDSFVSLSYTAALSPVRANWGYPTPGSYTDLNGNGATPPVASTGTVPGTSYIFTDGGLVGNAAAVPSASGTGAADARYILDVITDGSYLYVATIDDLTTADPNRGGRLLQFNPLTDVWTQIGPIYPIAAVTGTPGTLAIYDGALTFATYDGVAPGAVASYITGTGVPLPAGGVPELHNTANAYCCTSMAVFNGNLYVGMANAGSAIAALVVKRLAVATWSTSLTAGATANLNAYTLLYVYNGKLYAGWTSGDGGTAAIIKSTADGVTWTTELTLATTEVPCQATTFNGELYVVLGKTGASYNTSFRTIKRTVGGTWSTVDTPSDSLAGGIGVLYA